MTDKFKVPSGEINRRIKRIKKELQDNGIDALFIVQRVDLFYFSGTAQTGFLYIPSESQPLLLIRRYLPRAREESSIENIVEINSIKEVPGLIVDFYGKLPGTIALEFDVLPLRDFNFYKEIFDIEKFVDGSPFIHKIRMIKSAWEIEQIEKTAELSQKTFEYMKSAIRPGLTEMEFSGMYQTFARKHGHGAKLRVRNFRAERYFFNGKNNGPIRLLESYTSEEGISAAFPSGEGNKLLAPGEPILIDFGSVLNGYHMVETRTFAIDSMPERTMDACRAAIEMHKTMLELVKPGISLDELFRHSVETPKSFGSAEPKLDLPGYEARFVGHGIGLELIEPPIISLDKKDRIEPGTTFALEFKVVFKNEFSAGIKSVFLATEQGARLISKVPLEIFIC